MTDMYYTPKIDIIQRKQLSPQMLSLSSNPLSQSSSPSQIQCLGYAFFCEHANCSKNKRNLKIHKKVCFRVKEKNESLETILGKI